MSYEEFFKRDEDIQARIDYYELDNYQHQIQIDLNRKEIYKLRQEQRELRINYNMEADL